MATDSRQKLFKRRVLRRKDANSLKEEASAFLGAEKYRTVSRAEIEGGTKVYLFDVDVLLARKDGVLFPTLMNPNLENLPSVTVDMGAVPYVCNGADVMAPGIVEVNDTFLSDDLLVIRDVQHGKALAVGMALVSSKCLKEMRKGKAIINLHHVGDKLWNAIA
jgi:PUA domain protein